MERYIQKIEASDVLIRAARDRIKDGLVSEQVNEQFIEGLAQTYLSNVSNGLIPNTRTGSVISSIDNNQFLKDRKFLVRSGLEQTNILKESISNLSTEFLNKSTDIESQILGLESDLSEVEIQKFDNWSTVYMNSFSRATDKSLEDSIIDWKTGDVLTKQSLLEEIFSGGLTLPLIKVSPILMSDIYLTKEDSDYGNVLIKSNSPRKLITKDSFYHVIGRRLFDETTRTYLNDPPVVVLEVEFSTLATLNSLKISSVGRLSIQRVTYISASLEEHELDVELLDLERQQVLLFTPIEARYFRLHLTQTVPVLVTDSDLTSRSVEYLNQLLLDSGFHISANLPEREKLRIYDFSIQSLEFALCSYESLGYHLSKTLLYKKPLALEVSLDHQAIEYIDEYQYNDISYVEPYLAFKNVFKTKEVLGLVPIPHETPTRELLVSNSNEFKVRFFPDVLGSYNLVRVLSSEVSGPAMLLTLENELDLNPGDVITFFGAVKGQKTVVSVGATVNVVGTTAWDESDSYVYIQKTSSLFLPFSVYANDTLLTLSDYDYLLNGVWLNTIPDDTYLVNPVAGQFKIRLKNLDPTKVYSISYSVAPNQSLGIPAVSLKNGKVVFNGISVALLSLCLISRASHINHYLTNLIYSYSIKVKEDES